MAIIRAALVWAVISSTLQAQQDPSTATDRLGELLPQSAAQLILPATRAAALESAYGAVVSLEDAHAKTLRAHIPFPPGEDLWNDIALPHLTQERWFRQTDSPENPLNSPVSPACWLLRDQASISSAPTTRLSPLVISPPYLYLPSVSVDDSNPQELYCDSPNFHLILPKPRSEKIPIPIQPILEKLEDTLVLMRLMPVYFAKAQPRDVPMKVTIRFELDPSDSSFHTEVVGDTVTVKIRSISPSLFLEGSVRGLTDYFLHPMAVHPVIRTGFQEILLMAKPQRIAQETKKRKTAAERKADRLAEREAKRQENELRKMKIPGVEMPSPRTYSLNETVDQLKLYASERKSFNHELTKCLSMIVPHEEWPSKNKKSSVCEQDIRCAAPVITAFFLFGDSEGDPVHLQNYFTSLQCHGSNQKAHALLYYGRSENELKTEILRWAKP